MSTQSDHDTVVSAMRTLESGALIALPAMIEQLMSVPPPKGNPATVRQIAGGYQAAASAVDTQSVDVTKVTNQDLPEVWVGKASEAAGDVLVAVAEDLRRGGSVFTQAQKVLSVLADAFTDAHDRHANAQGPLRQAMSAAESADFGRARSLGLSGGEQLKSALETAINAAHTAVRDLGALTDEARAHQLNSGNLSASDRLVLGEAGAPGGPHDLNLILSENDAERAAQRLDKLSADDRKRFDDLLANAKSPQERAYLMKTLGAGHSVDELARFDGLIHDHGDDPDWLAQHLTPITTTTAQHADVTYQGGSWTQGSYPTCVSSSTIMARAMVDPSYTLGLTTGNKPDDPNSTSRDAFLARLRGEQQSLYDHGREDRDNWWDHLWGNDGPGMTDDESENIANEDIGKYNGQHYDQQDIDGAGERREVLPRVETAVDQGKPVPIQLDGSGDIGHQVVIIGHQGNMLQVYNPWGTVSWVSEDDFVNGHLDKIDSGVPPNVRGVNLPG
jgi:hypothetical protein